MSVFKKLLSGTLVALMVAQSAVPIFANRPEFFRDDNNTLIMTDAGGNTTVVDQSWEETYPSGTFAFNTTQVNLTENGSNNSDTGSLILYRLGGTSGRAIAKVTLIPTVSYLDDTRLSYAYAAGRDDYLVEVENPNPSALTDPLGGTPERYEPGAVLLTRVLTQAENIERGIDEGTEFCFYLEDQPDASDFRWQIRLEENGEWTDIAGATGEDLPASREIMEGLFDHYDVRCMYTADGVNYCSESYWGETYVQPAVYEMDGWEELAAYYSELDAGEEFSPILFEGGEYDNYSFYVVFADGEDEKEIRFTALDDDNHEAREVVNILIQEAYGAELYNSANVATAAIQDDEPELPSAMGFESREIWADMSMGSVRIPLIRTVDDPAALVYVTGADYTVAEGSALPGRNYAATEDGTLLFPSDLEYSALEIPLINDGEILSKEDSDLYFTVRLTAAKGGGSSTLIEGHEEITVRLYNSGEGNASNIASRMYSADEVDGTLNVEESVSVVAPAASIVAEAEDKTADAVAEYIPAVDGAMSRIINYGKLSFSGVENNPAYWNDKLLIYNEDNAFSAEDTADTDRHETLTWDGGRAYGDGWEIVCKKGTSAFAKIPNMYERFSNLRFYMKGYAEKYMSDYNVLGYRFNPDGTTYSVKYPGQSLGSSHYKNMTTDYTYTIGSSDTGIGLVARYENTALIKYNADAWIELRGLYLTRNKMNVPTVKIYTADDDLIYKNESILNQDLYNALEPEISMAAGKGGVTDSGSKIYAGSLLNLKRGQNASSYSFASTANGPLSGAVTLYSTTAGKSLNTAAPDANGNASLTMLFNPSNLKDNLELRIYMDRSQTVTLDISPSVPRVIDENKNVTSSIDAGKISATWTDLKDKNNGTVSLSGKELNPSSYTFQSKNSSLDLGAFTAAAGSAQYKSGKIKNLQTINFGLDEKDVILFNGQAYKGNETITIPVSMLLNDNLTFYYYDEAFLNMENVMSATIARVERYLDLNDNGIVDGTYNAQNGVFTVDGDLTLESITDIPNFPITSLAPQYYDGAYHQTILKVYYTMLPRCMEVTQGHSKADTAEVVPAIVTNVTAAAARGKMTAEQLGYRYINHGTTGAGKLMFGAEASKISYVDIPLGGDMNPPTVENNKEVWEPSWVGNPYPGTEFTDPQPVTLNGTALGDNYSVGETTSAGILTDDGIKNVAAYLSSMQENDRFALCVRETAKPVTRSTEPVHTLSGIESSTISDFYTYPSTTGVRNLRDPYAEQDQNAAGFSMSESDNPMSEYNMDGEINMPELELSLTDYVTISTNGQELSISVGANLIGFKSESGTDNHLKPQSPEMNSIYHEGQEGIEKVKNLYNTLFTHGANSKDGIGKSVKDEFNNLKKAGQDPAKKMPGIKSLGFEGNIAFNISLVLKWNPLENSFFFYQLMVMFAGELQFSFSVKLTPCPIFYVSITVGIGLELATGLERQRVKVRGETINLTDSDGQTDKADGGWEYYKNQFHMGHEALDEPENTDFMVGKPGAQLIYETNAKAIDIAFAGSMYVDAVDADGNRPEGFSPGVISSAGDEIITVKLAKVVNGTNDRNYTVTFTVVDDKKERHYEKDNANHALEKGHVIFDSITTIEKQTDDVYFAGFQLSPELFMEVAVGIGVELFNIELFINITIGASFGFINHDSPEYAQDGGNTEGAVVNEFSFVAGVGIRVTALFFNFEFNAVQFAVTYDRNATYDEDTAAKNGWNFTWYAANQPVKTYRSAEEPDPLKVRIVLPGALAGQEKLFSPEENAGMSLSRAFTPADKDVPFQYSGYGSSGDAFTLGKDLLPGSTYELVTAGGNNYVVYTVSTPAEDSINTTSLVLSKVKEIAVYEDAVYEEGFEGNPDDYVADTYLGLVNPINDSAPIKYLVLDNDGCGDLDFSAWVDKDEIRAAWVSYTDQAADAFNTSADPVTALQKASVHTVVKTVSFNTASRTLGTPEQVSPTEVSGKRGIYTSPSGAGDMIFYSEAIPYTEDELAALLAAYEDVIGYDENAADTDSSIVDGEKVYHGSSDPTLAFQMQQKEMQAAVYGKSFYPSFAYRTENGTYTNAQVKSQNWIDNSVNLENAALTMIGDHYYAAYTTAQTILENDTETVIRKLYLQKITVSDEEITVQPTPPAEEETESSGEETTAPEPEIITVTNITPSTAVAVRKLLDNRTDNSLDGVYSGGTLMADGKYKDPYFANVKFLTGRLGNLESADESFGDTTELESRMRTVPEPEEFLLFDMNGNSYIIRKADILSITGDSHSGGIIPFFTRRTAQEISATDSKGELIASNITIGADGSGNISAVYTASVENTSNTALYLTKYDPQSETWGAGTMLAMHQMQVHEDSVREDWSTEDTQKAYFAPVNGNVYNFTFGRTAIAPGADDKLLVLAEGSRVLLEEQPKYTPVYDKKGNLLELKPDGTTYLPMTDDSTGAYAISDGIYALSFGAGTSSLGYASLHLSNYDFTPNSEMYASVSFTNMGDTAIRASQVNPVTIELMSSGSTVPLQTWYVRENIRAGQAVSTTSEYVILPTNLKQGDKLYFKVYEDKNYVGANAFDQHTMTGAGEPDTAACITVENRVELGYESTGIDESTITMVSADENTVTLQANIHAGNRGSMDSHRTYLKVEYEDMQGDELVISPVNLEGHRLSVSEQQALTRSVTEKTLRNGYLLLATTENGEAVKHDDTGSIDSMYGRTITGTFTVPKSYFDIGYGTHSLNLRLTLEGYDENGNLYEEYDMTNNITFVSVEQKTFFETANNLNIQVGSYLRIPLTMQTSRQESPSITVTEITDDNERNLSMLYYDAVQGAIIIMPSETGEGKIHVADANTNSIYDICYTVIGEGLEMNIYEDNGIFTWLDRNMSDGKTGRDAWDFNDTIMRWNNVNANVPLRNDIAQADPGEAFTFRTLAESIDLYFMGEGSDTGKIQVSSTLEGFLPTTYTSDDGSKAVRIDFGNSHAQIHTVTVKAVDGIVRFDKMIENFPADFEVKTDPAAPNLYYNRTLPRQASMEEGVHDTITLGIYFLDMGGLTSVSVDSTDITSGLTRVNDSNELWYYEMAVTENTGHSFVITDQSGNTTTRTLSVDWFSTVVKEENRDPGAEDIRVIIVDENGDEVTGVMDSNKNYCLLVVDKDGNAVEGAKVSSIPFGSTDEVYSFNPLGSTGKDGLYALPGSAVYRVEYTPDGSSVTSTRMLCIDMGSTSYPSPLLKYDSSTKKLNYSVIVRDTSTTGKLTISSPIVSVKLDDSELLVSGQKVTYFEGTQSYEASGKYTLTAVNENGKEASAVLVIPEMPIEFKGEVLEFTMVTEAEDGTDNNDGCISINEAQIIGGVRDGSSKRADYEYALVPAGETPEEWQDETEFPGLAVGRYTLHIRDANDPDNVLTIDVTIGYESVRIDSFHSEPTALSLPSGSITLEAQGGYSDLEYSYVPSGADILDNGTPDDDSDDEISYAGVTYSLWTDRSSMSNLPEGIYTVKVREAANHNNTAIVQIHVPHVVTIEEIRTVPVQNNENNGQIVVVATGGYGELEYSYVPDGAEILDNGTPDDDSDDTVLYGDAEYPLWTSESQMSTMPTGMYTVLVRDERLSTVQMTDVEVPDHMVIRVETVPTYEDESTGSVTVMAVGGYGEFEYCLIPLADDGTLRDDAVIGSAEDEDGDSYQTITFNGREEAPLWTTEYDFTNLPKGNYMIIVRDTMDPMNSGSVYPDIDELLNMTDNQYTAAAKAEIRNHDKFEITVSGDIGTDITPEGLTLVQRHRGLTVYFEPKSGFQLMQILIDGKIVNVHTSYTFENVNEPHSIQITSRQLETIPKVLLPLEVSSTEGGHVEAEGRLLAAYGSSRTLRITADEGWRIADVLVDGKSVGPVTSYRFRAVIEAHTLHAVFEKIEEDINP